MSDDVPSARGSLLLAAIATVLIGNYVPHGRTLLFPFTLLATWVHEMGHGLTALAVNGGFDRLEIFTDAGGLAYTSHSPGVQSGLVSLGGLLAAPFVGALMLAIARGPRRARLLLLALGGGLIVSTIIWVRTGTGFIAMPLVAVGVLAAARWGGARERIVVAQFIGLRLALDTMGRGLDYLFTDEVVLQGVRHASDISGVAQGLGGPRLLWSLAISGVCVFVVLLGLYAAWRGNGAAVSARGSRGPPR